MVRFGIVSNVDATLCRVRVKFDADAIVSHWIPVSMPGTNETKFFAVPEVGSHVACLMDSELVEGVCLGAIYDEGNAADGSEGLFRILFSDDSVVSYDAGTSRLEATVGNTTFVATPSGFEISRGGESIKTILSDFLNGIAALTVTCAAPGSPSTPPVNLATFTALITRLNNLFTA
jgi:phage baseplate assembly protein gpV